MKQQHPQHKEYIITEEDFACLIEYSYAEDNVACTKSIIKKIQTHPHTPAAPAPYRLCDNCNIIELEEKLMNLEQELQDTRAKILREVESDEWLKEHDRAEREKVLELIDKAKDGLQETQVDGQWDVRTFAKIEVLSWLRHQVESLRGGAP